MDIKYLGHSSFRLKGKSGSVVMDPFDSKAVGLPFPKVSAEIVTISHDHNDHNQWQKVSGTNLRETPFVINAPGEYEINGIGVIGTAVWHDNHEGEDRGRNTIYVVHMDGMLVCHLGDLGHELSDKQVARVGSVDVLMVPMGGKYTLEAGAINKVIERLSPSVVIPMHYKVDGMSSQFDELLSLEQALEKTGLSAARKESKLTLGKDSLPEETEVVVLEI